MVKEKINPDQNPDPTVDAGYIVKTRLKHDGEVYESGETLERDVLNDKQAAELIRLGAIVDGSR